MEVASITIMKGEEIHKAILDYVLAHEIRHALIIGAIGSAVDLSVATPIEHDPPLRTIEVPYQASCEIVGMSGEIMPWEECDPRLKAVYPDKDSPLFVHIHIAAAIMGGQVFGGGLRKGKAFRSIRVFLLPQAVLQDAPGA